MGFDKGPIKTVGLKKAAALEAEVIVAHTELSLALSQRSIRCTHTCSHTMQPPLWYL